MWISIGITVIISELLTLWGIYGIGQYGIALFILTPLFIGAGSSILYGYKRGIIPRTARRIAFLTLLIYIACLLLFAIEGLICIAMAAPVGLLLTWIGSILGAGIVNKKRNTAVPVLILLTCTIPAVAFIEEAHQPALVSVTTSIEIHAAPEVVWQNVLEFPQLDEPDEFIFKAGIAYPTHATIVGKGRNAVRYCNFTTGSFVEPITVWDPPHLLKFRVEEQPEPMKELSFWDIDAPHLHDYFISKQGQFKLTKLPNGNTQLEGTTWYYHNISPAFYWQLWSEYIVHTIHRRVLAHIKKSAEHNASPVQS
ncbi:SRPBCC family protein [Rurimicrobium arvi]